MKDLTTKFMFSKKKYNRMNRLEKQIPKMIPDKDIINSPYQKKCYVFLC